MATSIQFLRSDEFAIRPDPNTLEEGMPMLNFHEVEPGLYFKLADGTLCKVGPTAVQQTAPNSAPQGFEGNAIGEMWVDTSASTPVLKIWNGAAWLAFTSVSTSLPVLADNTAALAAGLVAGDTYRKSTGELMIVF